MTNKNDTNTTESQADIDGVTFAYRCDICWQELDDTDIQFKPCQRCHLQVCLFCFNKHTTRKESYAKTCPKCREPIDMDQIMKQNPNNMKAKANPLRNNNKKRKRKNKKENKADRDTTDNNSNSIDIDEEVPKTDWKNYLKGRFISRDSIIVAPVIAKFNHEEAISDNFKVYGRITRINMWDDESAHIMYDKQYFADALVDKIQDVAVRYQGQFGLMSAKYHFRRPCEEFMDPERRCPMQCRKFHGPYYKLDFIPLDEYLDEETREQWIQHRRKHVSGTVKARYKKFRKKFMDGASLPMPGDESKKKRERREMDNNYYAYDEYEYEYYEDGDYGSGYDRRYNAHSHAQNMNMNMNTNTNTVTLKYNAMGKANKLLALDDSLQKHMRHRPGQPLPPSRPPPPPPLPQPQPLPLPHSQQHSQPHSQPHPQSHSQSQPRASDDISDKSESITGSNNDGNNSNSGSVGSQKRTRPPIHHTTSAQMRPFMASNPNIFSQRHGNNNGGHSSLVKGKKVQKLMTMQKMCRTQSEDSNVNLRKMMQLRSTKSDPDCEYNASMHGMHGRKSPYHEHGNGYNSHNRGDYNKAFSSSSSSLQRLYSSAPPSAPKAKPKSKTVDLLKSLKKKKRKQRSKTKPKSKLQPTRQPIPHHIPHKKHAIHHIISQPVMPKEALSSFKPHNNLNLHVNPASFANNTLTFNPYNNYSFAPNPAPRTFTAVSPKKSKLNANAASYKPLSATTTAAVKQSKNCNVFKLPHIHNINNINILNVDYDFGAALNESHLDLKDHEDEKESMHFHNEISSDDSSDDEYDIGVKWSMASLWDKLCDLIKKQRPTQPQWQHIRKLLKAEMSVNDWKYVKENKLIKKIKAKFRMEFGQNSDAAAAPIAAVHVSGGDGVEGLLNGLDLQTSEAASFVNLEYAQCNVIDIDLRISDIRNYMTDLLTLTRDGRERMPSQYDTSIIAELGQILNIYQAWIDEKKKEGNNGNVVAPCTESDFYSRLLDEVQEKAMYEHGDHDYFDDGDSHNPKDLVMDYIGLNVENINTIKENDELYQYEYSDDTDEQKIDCEKRADKEKELGFEEIAYDEDTASHKELEDDNKNDSNKQEDDVLYEYEEEEEAEAESHEVVQVEENGIFSRVHSPPPRHRNGDNGNGNGTEVVVEEEKDMNANEEELNIENVEDMNGDINRHYYNARYPPRRGRYGHGRNMESGNGGNGHGGYYRQRNQNVRYNMNNINNMSNMNNKSNINPPKMEWKKKEKEMEKEKEKEIIISTENEDNDNNNLNAKNRQETIENEEK